MAFMVLRWMFRRVVVDVVWICFDWYFGMLFA